MAKKHFWNRDLTKGLDLKRGLVLSILGLLLLWLGIGLTYALVGRFLERPPLAHTDMAWALAGFFLYLVFHLFFYKPLLSHILAHELTHALAAVMLGGRVTAVHATTSGGSTLINKSHWFISLAPYVFPFYAAISLGIWAIAAQSFRPGLAALTGFLYAFHWALTIYTLTHPQPDLKDAGTAFSLIFIFTGNMMTFMVLVLLLWPAAFTPAAAFDRTLEGSFRFVVSIWSLLKSLIPPREAVPR